MLLQNIRARIGARLNGDAEAGFTLIELLVVMLILGILAAIALPAFFNQKSKANDAKAKETLHSAQVAMETCSTEHNGEYPVAAGAEGCQIARLEQIEPTLSGAGVTAEPNEPAGGYTLSAEGSSGHTFEIVRGEAGGLSFPCAPAGEGGCPAGGWGNG